MSTLRLLVSVPAFLPHSLRRSLREETSAQLIQDASLAQKKGGETTVESVATIRLEYLLMIFFILH